MKTVHVPIAFGLLWLSGCIPQQAVRPDPMVPHQVSKPARISVWVPVGDGKAVEQVVQIEAGWWVASPVLVDPLR